MTTQKLQAVDIVEVPDGRGRCPVGWDAVGVVPGGEPLGGEWWVIDVSVRGRRSREVALRVDLKGGGAIWLPAYDQAIALVDGDPAVAVVGKVVEWRTMA